MLTDAYADYSIGMILTYLIVETLLIILILIAISKLLVLAVKLVKHIIKTILSKKSKHKNK